MKVINITVDKLCRKVCRIDINSYLSIKYKNAKIVFHREEIIPSCYFVCKIQDRCSASEEW